MNLHKLLSAAAAACVLTIGPAHAELINNASQIGSGSFVQNFADAASYDTSTMRVQIGASLGIDLGVTGTPRSSLLFGAPFGAWSLGSNGEWTSALNFVGIDNEGDPNGGIFPSIVFDFGVQTVSAIGAFMNFDPDFTFGGFPLPLYIAAYGSTGQLLEDYFLPLFTPGGINAGQFYGISLTNPLISRFEISGPYAVATNLTFSAPVPEPSTYALMVAGLIAMGAMARRRQKKV